MKPFGPVAFVFVGALSLVACGDDFTEAVADSGTETGTGLPEASSPGDANVTDASGDAEAGSPDSGPPGPFLPPGPRDRAGRPYMAYLFSVGNRELYNVMPGAAATDNPGDASSFGADLQSSLATLDALDAKTDWNGGAADAGPDDAGVFPHPLVNQWMAADVIVVDPNKPFATNGYLEIETQGAAHTTCGGRWLAEDTLDITFSYLVGKELTGVSDGVSAPGKAPSLQFPYLASPY